MNWIKNHREILIGSVGALIIYIGVYRLSIMEYFVVMVGLAIHGWGAIDYGTKNERKRKGVQDAKD